MDLFLKSPLKTVTCGSLQRGGLQQRLYLANPSRSPKSTSFLQVSIDYQLPPKFWPSITPFFPLILPETSNLKEKHFFLSHMELQSSSNASIYRRFPFFLLNASSIYLPLTWNVSHPDFNYNICTITSFLLDCWFPSAVERTSFWSHNDQIPAPVLSWLCGFMKIVWPFWASVSESKKWR